MGITYLTGRAWTNKNQWSMSLKEEGRTGVLDEGLKQSYFPGSGNLILLLSSRDIRRWWLDSLLFSLVFFLAEYNQSCSHTQAYTYPYKHLGVSILRKLNNPKTLRRDALTFALFLVF